MDALERDSEMLQVPVAARLRVESRAASSRGFFLVASSPCVQGGDNFTGACPISKTSSSSLFLSFPPPARGRAWLHVDLSPQHRLSTRRFWPTCLWKHPRWVPITCPVCQWIVSKLLLGSLIFLLTLSALLPLAIRANLKSNGRIPDTKESGFPVNGVSWSWLLL